jgi:sigma-B regulation protein RsbU (phosphoserine phosphatase)
MTSSAARIRLPRSLWAERTSAVPPVTLPTLLREFELGAKYQKSLQTPLPSLPGYDLYGFTRAAHLLTGDYYDCFPLGKQRLGLLVADASGKGIAGALLAATFRSVVRNLPPDRYEKPNLFMKTVNTLLHRTVPRGTFVSAIYGILDAARNEIVVSNAGHLPMLVHHGRRGMVAGYTRNAPALGVLHPKLYEPKIAEVTVRLDAGDRLILFTYGVNEAKAPSQTDFGLTHLHHRLVRDHHLKSKELVANIVDEVDIHRSGWEQSDDITIVAAQRKP